ncbi:MAG: nitroreductase family protein [Nitrospinae bacterium]|nr:nitroreductase family protein [Nitrospinota bacterium]MBL7021017.1 nitroreductase family protein [Nitrospinaceae bacterium]
MEFSETVRQRQSIKSYKADKTISDAELKELMQEVVLSPSSFNLQHWTFIAVQDTGIREKIKAAAWGQEQVGTCSVLLVICGKLNAHQDAPEIYQDVDQEIQDQVFPLIDGFYEDKKQFQRDEAIRSSSLAAMTLMLAAQNRGWATVPMIGFDPEAVAKLVNLKPNYIPVMLMAMGFKNEDSRPRGYRRPIEEVVRINTLDGPGLTG